MKKRGFKVAFIALAAIAGFSAVTMLLWNCLIPGIFGLGTINFWQALGLLVLSRILFSGMGGHGRFMAGKMGHGMHGRNPIHEKWMKMTPEERKEFLKKREKWMFGKGGFPPHHGPFGHPHFGHDHFGQNPFGQASSDGEENDQPKKEE